jgi:AcrR family transcriptional regulator
VPKIVDHEERRQQLVEAVWRVINRCGLEKTTVREIALESGYSTGSLAHYFPTKDDILRSALERADQQIRDRLDQMPADARPVTRLRDALRQALPLDEEREFELTLDVNFWARALNQPALRTLQHRDHDGWRTCILDLVRESQRAGQIDRKRKADVVTDLLVGFVDGIGLQGLVYPELITRQRIDLLLDALLVSLGANRRYLVPLPAVSGSPGASSRPSSKQRWKKEST